MMATGLLAALTVTPAHAQTALAMVTDPEPTKALELEKKAEALYEQPGRYAEAARLHLRAAAERTSDDPLHVRDLYMAARLFYYAGNKTEALAAMERTAESALAAGDVLNAANAFIDASHLARETGNAESVTRFAERARLLTKSPLLGEKDRTNLQARLDHE
jgi:hypothetical protein